MPVAWSVWDRVALETWSLLCVAFQFPSPIPEIGQECFRTAHVFSNGSPSFPDQSDEERAKNGTAHGGF